MTNSINSIKSKEFICPKLNEKYTVYSHPSGLDIYIFPKKSSTAYAFFGTRYGSIDNTFKLSGDKDFVTVPDGIAHFLEHKLFANEDGSDSFEHFSELGADANAYTSFSRTAYYFGATENFYESLCELLSFVTHPYFTKESVKKEIGIIAEEIRMYNDSPSDRCFYGMLDGLYEHHSIKKNICGSESSIARITPELLYECYRVFYNLSNMVLVVVGDVCDSEILSIADRLLPNRKVSDEIVRRDENILEKKEAVKVYTETKMNVSKPIFSIGIKDTDLPQTPDEVVKKDIELMILNDMLFSQCSDFYNDLLDREIIYPKFRSDNNTSDRYSFITVSGEADDPLAVFEEFKSYIAALKKKGLDRDDFMRAKRIMYAEYVKTFDSSESIANMLFSSAVDGIDVFLDYTVLSAITFEDVEEQFKKAFCEEYMTLSVVNPMDTHQSDQT